MGRYITVYKEVGVEITFDDVMEYITEYASDSELQDIRNEVKPISTAEFNNSVDGSYIIEEKKILLIRAANKYTLEELEQRLGNKFDLA